MSVEHIAAGAFSHPSVSVVVAYSVHMLGQALEQFSSFHVYVSSGEGSRSGTQMF